MNEHKCPKCGSTKCKWLKYKPDYYCDEYICESCGEKFLSPDSTWD